MMLQQLSMGFESLQLLDLKKIYTTFCCILLTRTEPTFYYENIFHVIYYENIFHAIYYENIFHVIYYENIFHVICTKMLSILFSSCLLGNRSQQMWDGQVIDQI